MGRERIDGVLAKLDRASEHLDALESEVAVFLRRNPYEVTGYLDRDQRTWTHVLRIHREPPLRVATLIGDVAHNLRSALDHLLWQLVEVTGGTPGRHNQFPIALTHEQWRDARLGAPRRLRGLGSIGAAAEIQRLQPYLGRNESGHPARHPLAVLNKIANTDKHSLLMPTAGVMEGLRSAAYRYNDDVGGVEDAIVLVEPGGRLEDGTELVRLTLTEPLGPEPHVKMEGLRLIDVSLGEGPPPDDVLRTISEFIRGEVVPTFERFF